MKYWKAARRVFSRVRLLLRITGSQLKHVWIICEAAEKLFRASHARKTTLNRARRKCLMLRTQLTTRLHLLLQENISTPEPADISEEDHYSSKQNHSLLAPLVDLVDPTFVYNRTAKARYFFTSFSP